MKLLLMSGGPGTRLWPLSNVSRPKQFLKLLKNKNCQLESMIQRVCKQLEVAKLTDSSLIMTNKSYQDMIRSQICYKFPLIIEPERRDTFPAIALATSYLKSIKNVNEDEVVIVIPTDMFVGNDFFEEIKKLENIIQNSEADLALIGVTPTEPSEKYGYIIPTVHSSFDKYIKVHSFKEKPSKIIAENLLKKQAFWNCGVFAFKLGYMLSLLEEKGIPTDYNELYASYNSLKKSSFDYEVIENTRNIVTLPYNGYWSDLGTWDALTEQIETSSIGSEINSYECKNTHIISEINNPITVIGLSNIIVAVSPDGILVADKSTSPKIKNLVKDFNHRPMFEERRWGSYKVLEYIKRDDGNQVLTKRLSLLAGKNLSYQLHHKRSEVWTITHGKGVFALDGKIIPVKSGDVLKIPLGYKHGIKALTDMEIIEVQTGNKLIEEDIIRFFIDWEDVEKHCVK